MPEPSAVLRIGVAVALCAGAGCDRNARTGAVTADAATAVGVGSDAQGDTGDEGAVIAAAGDIACGGCEQAGTADLLDDLLQTRGLAAVLPLGDEAYKHGLLSEFESFYRPSWGRPELLAITHPIPGNHEYVDTVGAGYFDFFDGPGQATGIAGPRDSGYYSFDLAGWHVIALNTSDDCRWVSCDAGSPQHQWLVADLAAHPAPCTLALFHQPRYEAGTVAGETAAAAPLWDALYDAGADVVLNGHEHGYQQLSPLNKAGEIDLGGGIRTFVVGTGGGDYDTAFGGPRLGALETKIVGVHGVLQMTLRPTGYDWRFVPIGGDTPAGASGSAACH